MEEKIVENKKEDLPSLDLFHSLTSITSLIYLSIYLVCVQSTTPLWFTDKPLAVGSQHRGNIPPSR